MYSLFKDSKERAGLDDLHSLKKCWNSLLCARCVIAVYHDLVVLSPGCDNLQSSSETKGFLDIFEL